MHTFSVRALAALSRLGAPVRFNPISATRHQVLQEITDTLDIDAASDEAMLATQTAPWASRCPHVFAALRDLARATSLPR